MSQNSFDDIIDPIWNRCMQSRFSSLFCIVLGVTLSISCFSVIPSILKLPRNKATMIVCVFSGCVFLIMCLSACFKFLRLKFISIDELQEPVNHEESGINLSDSFCVELEPTICPGGLEESNASTKILDLSCTPVSSSQQSAMPFHCTLEQICSYISSRKINEFRESQEDAELIQVLSSISARMIRNVGENKELVKLIKEISPKLFREILSEERCAVSELEFSNTRDEIPCNSRKENSVTTGRVMESRSGTFPSETETSSRSDAYFSAEMEPFERSDIYFSAEMEPFERSDIYFSAEMEPFERSDIYFSAEMEPFERSDTYFSAKMKSFERSDTYFATEMKPFEKSDTYFSTEMKPFEKSDTYFSVEMEPFKRSDTYFSA